MNQFVAVRKKKCASPELRTLSRSGTRHVAPCGCVCPWPVQIFDTPPCGRCNLAAQLIFYAGTRCAPLPSCSTMSSKHSSSMQGAASRCRGRGNTLGHVTGWGHLCGDNEVQPGVEGFLWATCGRMAPWAAGEVVASGGVSVVVLEGPGAPRAARWRHTHWWVFFVGLMGCVEGWKGPCGSSVGP